MYAMSLQASVRKINTLIKKHLVIIVQYSLSIIHYGDHSHRIALYVLITHLSVATNVSMFTFKMSLGDLFLEHSYNLMQDNITIKYIHLLINELCCHVPHGYF